MIAWMYSAFSEMLVVVVVLLAAVFFLIVVVVVAAASGGCAAFAAGGASLAKVALGPACSTLGAARRLADPAA